MSKRHVSRTFILWAMLITMPLTGAGVDIFAPALPYVVKDLNSQYVQLAIGVYVIFYGLFQLLAGPILDSYGHKKTLLVGLVIYIVASIGSSFSESVSMLLIMRGIQGAAVAIPAVAIRTILTSIYEKKEIPIAMNYVTTAWSLGPVVAPFIGSYLTHYISWHASLAFLGIYACIGLVMFSFMHETNQKRHPFHLGATLKSYGGMLTHKNYMGVFLCMCLFYSLILCFNVVGPFLIQDELHFNVVQFGYMALILGIFNFAGGISNRFVMGKYGRKTSMFVFCILGLIGSLSMLGLSLAGIMNVYSIIVPTLILFYAAGFLFGTLYGTGLSIFPESPGKASALLGTLFVTGSGIITSLAVFLRSDTQLPLAITNLVIVVLCIVIYFVMIRSCFDESD